MAGLQGSGRRPPREAAKLLAADKKKVALVSWTSIARLRSSN